MGNEKYTDEQLSEISEDAFVNIKEACMRLQERTKCSTDIVIKMLKDVLEYYETHNDKKSINDL